VGGGGGGRGVSCSLVVLGCVGWFVGGVCFGLLLVFVFWFCLCVCADIKSFFLNFPFFMTVKKKSPPFFRSDMVSSFLTLCLLWLQIRIPPCLISVFQLLFVPLLHFHKRAFRALLGVLVNFCSRLPLLTQATWVSFFLILSRSTIIFPFPFFPYPLLFFRRLLLFLFECLGILTLTGPFSLHYASSYCLFHFFLPPFLISAPLVPCFPIFLACDFEPPFSSSPQNRAFFFLPSTPGVLFQTLPAHPLAINSRFFCSFWVARSPPFPYPLNI